MDSCTLHCSMENLSLNVSCTRVRSTISTNTIAVTSITCTRSCRSIVMMTRSDSHRMEITGTCTGAHRTGVLDHVYHVHSRWNAPMVPV